jgi:hypothetical protein
MLERDAALTPELLGDDKPERPTSEGMERVRDSNQRWISSTGGI